MDRVWEASGQHATSVVLPREVPAVSLSALGSAYGGPTQRGKSRLGAGRPRYATAMGVHETVTEPSSIDWDDVVDVVSVGVGATGLAAALASRAIGLRTYAAGVSPGGVGDLAGRLGITDSESAGYLKSVTSDTGPAAVPGRTLPIRYVDAAPADAERPAGGYNFAGAALRNWAAACLATPFGLLSTKVADPRLTTRYTSAGRIVEGVVVGTVELGGEQPEADVDTWLAALARDREVTVEPANTLQRLVFEDGDVVGVVIDTPSGSCAVRTRYGVMMALGDGEQRCQWPADGLAGVTTAEVAFVTRAASRYSRLELLVPDARR